MVGSRLTGPHIRFYISDYGFGHASRSIALMCALHASMNCTISVRTNTSADFIRDSCLFVSVEKKRNDIGTVMYDSTSRVNREDTERSLRHWISSWGTWITEETVFCKEHTVDLILSDITPQAFVVSKTLGIPGIGVSNFTWDLIFRQLYGNSPEVQMIHDAYASADLGLVLPLNESLDVFKERFFVPLVSRQSTLSREVMRKRLGISGNEILVHVGSGLSFNSVPACIHKLIDSDIRILVSENQPFHHPNIIRIPGLETETQNYIGACDLVVTKPGYSTVSESIRARIPLLIFTREGFAEDPYILQPLETTGIGKQMSWEAVEYGNWISHIDELLSMKENYQTCSDIFINDGTQACIEHIRSYL
ncbi:glycosyltransferase family protein [uncultured Methanocorpusculum sp.]|nr:glycosyltransferase family protein [uncultured Methanocorpusculum sp.]